MSAGKSGNSLMSDSHKRCIQENLVELTKHLDLSKMLDYLISKRVLDDYDVEKLNTLPEGGRMKRNHVFLIDIMYHKPDWAYQVLVDALQVDNTQSHLAELLQP